MKKKKLQEERKARGRNLERNKDENKDRFTGSVMWANS
jgi:hypothetical protein